jgi:hypothetical protein
MNGLQNRLLAKLSKLPDGVTMCPGRLAGDCGTVLAAIRGDLIQLAIDDKIVITQRGQPVAAENLKGPFRVHIVRRREHR